MSAENPEFGYDPLTEVTTIPSVDVETVSGEMVSLDWTNCTIRTFKDPQYNHVEYVDEEGVLQGLGVDEETIAALQELEYPELFMPIPDYASVEWISRALTKDLVELDTPDDIPE